MLTTASTFKFSRGLCLLGWLEKVKGVTAKLLAIKTAIIVAVSFWDHNHNGGRSSTHRQATRMRALKTVFIVGLCSSFSFTWCLASSGEKKLILRSLSTRPESFSFSIFWLFHCDYRDFPLIHESLLHWASRVRDCTCSMIDHSDG